MLVQLHDTAARRDQQEEAATLSKSFFTLLISVMVLALPLVCGLEALRAEKPHTMRKESTAVPERRRSHVLSLSKEAAEGSMRQLVLNQ
jgi:hypothetical protein